MTIPLAGFSVILELLYYDKMDIYRRHEVVNADGTTDIIIDTDPSLQNIPCRLSFSGAKDRADDVSVDANLIELNPTIHCSPDIEIKSGDRCKVYRCDDDGAVIRIYTGNLGDSRWYSNHQEVAIHIDKES